MKNLEQQLKEAAYESEKVKIEEDSVKELYDNVGGDVIEYLLNYWDWEEIYELYLDKDNDYLEAVYQCEVSPDYHEEAYAGQYRDDEDFAYETADNMGLIDKSANWPYSCIDWNHAAQELMYDYCSHNGYYFRIM